MRIDEIVQCELAIEAEKPAPAPDKYQAFYRSRAWRKLRYETLKKRGARCECCGRSSKDGVTICIDHILPIKAYWHLRLEPSNLQCLCSDDNLSKASTDTTDWR